MFHAKLGVIISSFAVAVFLSSVSTVPTDYADSLELIQLFVRHGNRSPLGPVLGLEREYYSTFWPFQSGQLLPAGRRQMAEVGSFIRNRYDWFLPKEFSYDAVTVICTAMPRVQESSAVAMAAMFPPNNSSQEWDQDGLGHLWTPIPCQYVPEDEDKVNTGDAATCPRFAELYARAQLSDAYNDAISYYSQNGTLNEYVANELGFSQPLPQDDLMNFFENLLCSVGANLQIPDWAAALYPHPAVELNNAVISLNFINDEMTKICIGEFIKEIFETAKQLQDNELPSAQKLIAYYGHDIQLAAFIKALGLLPKMEIPGYGAAMMMELYRNQTESKIGYRFVYRDKNWLEPKVLTVPGCEEICPLEYLENYAQKFIPTEPHHVYCKAKKAP